MRETETNCDNCKWYDKFYGICLNEGILFYADSLGDKDSCSEWEKQESAVK